MGEASRGKDFISLGLKDGHLVFRWALASCPPSPFPGSSLEKLPLPLPLPHTPIPTRSHLVGLCFPSYQLGSGEARLVSEDPINDGEWHRVTVLR